jgi:hypothetical protein
MKQRHTALITVGKCKLAVGTRDTRSIKVRESEISMKIFDGDCSEQPKLIAPIIPPLRVSSETGYSGCLTVEDRAMEYAREWKIRPHMAIIKLCWMIQISTSFTTLCPITCTLNGTLKQLLRASTFFAKSRWRS